MKKTLKIFSKIFVLAIAAVVICTFDASAATKKSKTTKKTTTPVATTVIVDNKTSKFNETLSDISAAATDTSESDRAERVRRQRALLDGAGNKDSSPKGPSVTGANTCDTALRKCMAEKCGDDFTKCSKDSTTIWGDKMDSCRRQTQCTGHEYALLAPEILADRDANERMAYYQSVVSCGNRYNSCIFAECGTTLNKCLSKSDGDRAVSKCESVAKSCKEQDSGLASRVMTVFATMRKIAQAQAVKDEKRLYELRDLMRNQCKRFGAMFDERTLDCVYTVNFFAGDDNKTPKASKKLYAGDTFQCNANWFGIDVTTFKENAYRLTRSQTAASSAMLGAGVGTAAGLLSSGAIGRALETQKAAKAVKEAKEAEENGGEGEGQGEGGGSNGGGDGSSSGSRNGSSSGGNSNGNNNNQNISPFPCPSFSDDPEQCNSYDNCFYVEGRGAGCEDNPTFTQQQDQGQQEQQNNNNNNNNTQNTVNLNFVVVAHNTDVKLKNVTLTCTYTDSNGQNKRFSETPNIINHHIKRRNVPKDAECTLTGGPCDPKTATAAAFANGSAASSRVLMRCRTIEECITGHGTWKGTNDEYGSCETLEDKCAKKTTAEKCATVRRCSWTPDNGGKCVPSSTLQTTLAPRRATSITSSTPTAPTLQPRQ